MTGSGNISRKLFHGSLVIIGWFIEGTANQRVESHTIVSPVTTRWQWRLIIVGEK